jgi:preprotein translocase subunit SecF
MIIPFIMIILALISIVYFGLEKGIDLKGADIFTFEAEKHIDTSKLEIYLEKELKKDVEIRMLTMGGKTEIEVSTIRKLRRRGLARGQEPICDSLIQPEAVGPEYIQLINKTQEYMRAELGDSTWSIHDHITSQSLGNEAEFTRAKQFVAIKAVCMALLFVGGIIIFIFLEVETRKRIISFSCLTGMAIILYFSERISFTIYNFIHNNKFLSENFDLSRITRDKLQLFVFAFFLTLGLIIFVFFEAVISFAVVLAAISDLIVTLGIMAYLKISVSLATIAALLILLGYSVDSDILLTTRVYKMRSGRVVDRIFKAIPTALTMDFTSMVALLALLLFTTSVILQDIAIVLLIGICVDFVNTWIQNAGILKFYLERLKE